jgi:hypothetical protein
MFSAMFQHANLNTPAWMGYFIQRPESHGIHHERGIHRYNYSDLPLWDIVFGTFRNPKTFAGEVGFEWGSSRRVGALLLGRDVSGSADNSPDRPESPERNSQAPDTERRRPIWVGAE